MKIVTIVEQSFWEWRKSEPTGTRLGQECKLNSRYPNVITFVHVYICICILCLTSFHVLQEQYPNEESD